MSAILSADDLNDFIAPGVACIKPIEKIPQQQIGSENAYEVTTEEKFAAENPTPAHISLTDCLACSGCVTSAEAVLVSLQSHSEVMNVLDQHSVLSPPWSSKINGHMNTLMNGHANNHTNGYTYNDTNAVNGAKNNNSSNLSTQHYGKIFVASISPQAKSSMAAAFGISYQQAENMIHHLLSGPDGLASGGKNGSYFQWVLDTNIFRSIALLSASEEVDELLKNPNRSPSGDGSALHDEPKRPILASACPGWICYAEKTHPHVLPHISRLKSPQALAGTLIKSTLYNLYKIHPSQIWHLAVMPCFDKKLEASRSELTSTSWLSSADINESVRDVDCVITPRELVSLAATRSIDLRALISLPRITFSTPFPDDILHKFLFTDNQSSNLDSSAGTSGGYLYHILRRAQASNPGSKIVTVRGRNSDVVEYVLEKSGDDHVPILKVARYYGFRNIQNLVRKLKPPRTSRLLGASTKPKGANAGSSVDYAYVEVMACPGGCTNGGGQIRAGEGDMLKEGGTVEDGTKKININEQKEWLNQVDEKYFENKGLSATRVNENDVVDGVSKSYIFQILQHWSQITGANQQELVCTSYRKVESDVGKQKSDIDRVVGLASSIGGGW